MARFPTSGAASYSSNACHRTTSQKTCSRCETGTRTGLPVYRHVIRLPRTWRAPAFAHITFHQAGEPLDHIGVLVREVVLLADVHPQVEELKGRGVRLRFRTLASRRIRQRRR